MAEEQPHPLERIIDDEEDHVRCLEYLCGQMIAGRTVEELVAEMIQAGWSAEDAEDLTEQARKQTRPQRGVLTQQEVLQESRRLFRDGWRNTWTMGFANVASVRRLIFSLFSLRFFRTRR